MRFLFCILYICYDIDNSHSKSAPSWLTSTHSETVCVNLRDLERMRETLRGVGITCVKINIYIYMMDLHWKHGLKGERESVCVCVCVCE